MTKNVKIPKKIAGVKIPKKARKTANKAIKMGTGPVVRELAAAAIGAAGAKAGERKDRHGGVHHVSGSARIQIEAGRIGEAFRIAAIDGLRRFIEGFEEGLRNINEQAAAEAGEAKPNPANGQRPGAARD